MERPSQSIGRGSSLVRPESKTFPPEPPAALRIFGVEECLRVQRREEAPA